MENILKKIIDNKKIMIKKLKLETSLNIIELTKILSDDMFVDSSHLNKKGHNIFAIKIAEEINKLVNND